MGRTYLRKNIVWVGFFFGFHFARIFWNIFPCSNFFGFFPQPNIHFSNGPPLNKPSDIQDNLELPLSRALFWSFFKVRNDWFTFVPRRYVILKPFFCYNATSDLMLSTPSSEYYSITDANNLLADVDNDSIFLFHCNIRSLAKKLRALTRPFILLW